jgi:hypothetical protein
MPIVKNNSKVPKIGAEIDKLWTLKVKLDGAKTRVKELEKQYNELSNTIIDVLPKEDIDGAYGRKAVAELVKKDHIIVKDWDKVYPYILENNAFDLLQKRINEKAFKDRLEEGEKVPGTGKFISKKLKLTQRK